MGIAVIALIILIVVAIIAVPILIRIFGEAAGRNQNRPAEGEGGDESEDRDETEDRDPGGGEERS